MEDYRREDLLPQDICESFYCGDDSYIISAIGDYVEKHPIHKQVIGKALRLQCWEVLSHYFENTSHPANNWKVIRDVAVSTGRLSTFKFIADKLSDRVSDYQSLYQSTLSSHNIEITKYIMDELQVIPNSTADLFLTNAVENNDLVTLGALLERFKSVPVFSLAKIVKFALTQGRFCACTVMFNHPLFSLLHKGRIATWCISEGSITSYKYMLDTYRFRPDQVQRDLNWAIIKDNYDVVNYILINGVDINDGHGTALRRAMDRRCKRIVDLLLSSGAQTRWLSAEVVEEYIAFDPGSAFWFASFLEQQRPNNNDEPVVNINQNDNEYRLREGDQNGRQNVAKRVKLERDATRNMTLERLCDEDVCPVCLDSLKEMDKSQIRFWRVCCHMICTKCYSPLKHCPICRQQRHLPL